MKREVLVRYLDVWTPVALRSHRDATFVEAGGGAFVVDAFRVFGESADRLGEHHLHMVIVGAATVSGAPPAGLSVRFVADPADLVVDGAALAHLDVVAGALSEADAWRLVASLGRDTARDRARGAARGKARDVVLTLPAAHQDYSARLGSVGLMCTAVELVAEDGGAELLVFATGDSKRLAVFKDELWAVDEFAGIRYRDPRDAEGTLVDISLTPQLLPLRRVLLAELARRGSRTVAELQRYTLLETMYRPADAVGALHSAVSAGIVTRDPEKGRLTARTVVSYR